MKLHMAKAHSNIINFIVLQIMKWSFELYEMDLEVVTQIRCLNCSLCISKKKIQIYEVDNHHNRLLPLLSQFHNKLTCGKRLKSITKFKALIGKHWGWQFLEASRFWPVKKYTLLFIANPNPTPKFDTSKYKHNRINNSFWIFLFSIGHLIKKFSKDKLSW